MTWLRERLPDDAIVTSDAGNFSGWPNRFLQYRRPGRQLGPTSGAMGYGVPAAVAAKLARPGSIVVGFCGDGGFLMTGQELATSLAEGPGPIILVFNNAMYGTIRMHQERRFPGRISGTNLKNPDFAALALAYGAFAATVSRTEEFAPAFEEAVAAKRAAVIELHDGPGNDHHPHHALGAAPPGRSGEGVREGIACPALTTIPTRKGKAALLRHGEVLRLINTHGGQVVDTWAFSRDDLHEFLSMAH